MDGRDSAGVQRCEGVRLRLGTGSWILVNGEYLVGRSASCQIVVDSPRVSRQHASLSVRGMEVILRDLGSSNGVFVNGAAIGKAAVTLDLEDRFVIGDVEFTLEATSVSVLSSSADTLPPEPGPGPHYRSTSGTFATPARSPSGFAPSGTHAPEVTAKKHALDLLGSVAERAIAAGYPARAEELLRPRLEELLRDARSRRPLEEGTVRQGVEWSLRLAVALKRSSWVEHAIGLLTSARSTCDNPTLTLLQRAQTLAPASMDVYRAYAAVLRELPSTLERLATERYVGNLLADALSR